MKSKAGRMGTSGLGGGDHLSRREFFWKSGLAVAGVLSSPARAYVGGSGHFDLLVQGGTILDGTGGPEWPADIGIRGDRIAAIGRIPAERADRLIDAAGLRVAPGFIDIHTHSDHSILRFPGAESRVHQGITTEVTGNCGGSAAPSLPAKAGSGDSEAENADGESVDRYLTRLQERGLAVNHALLVGQGTIRENRFGLENRPLTPEELAGIVGDLEVALEQGAFGLSTGLEYVPGRFTPAEEIWALARVVSRFGGLYASHIRSEEKELLEAVDEAIEVGRRTGVRVEISHLKAAGEMNWSKQRAALDLIESARSAGVPVLADAYPYPAYFTGLTIFVPTWAMDGGWAALRKRLSLPDERRRIQKEVDERVHQDPGDYDLIQINRVRSSAGRRWLGRRFSEIASESGKEPAEALLDLLLQEEGSVSFVGFGMSESNVALVIGHPLVMIGSDGSSQAPAQTSDEGTPHPRSYGAFPRVFARYVREAGVLDWPAAVRKMTTMPADQLGLKDRGRIAVGMKADLVLFEPSRIRDLATFEVPQQYPEGIPHVLVNGQAVVLDGKPTGKRPGQVLRRA